MSIIKRITHLVRADFHGILDHLEEPETLLKQAIREMKEQISKREESLEQLRQQRDKSKARGSKLLVALGESERQVNTCLESESETLIRTAMRRKLEIERSLKVHHSSEQAIEREIVDNEKRLKDENERLQSITEKMELFVNTSHATNSVSNEERLYVSEEDIDIAILEARKSRQNCEQQSEVR